MFVCNSVKLHVCHACNFAVYFALMLAALVCPDNKTNLNLLIFSFATKSPKILKNISKFKLIIADIEKNNYLIIDSKQLVSEFFKSVAFFSGHPGTHCQTCQPYVSHSVEI